MFFMCFLLSLRRVSRHLIITLDQCKCQHINIVSSRAKKDFKRKEKKQYGTQPYREKDKSYHTRKKGEKKSNVMHTLETSGFSKTKPCT
jgi:hypothetical protein